MGSSPLGGVPAISEILTQRIVVGIADIAVSNNPSICLSTFALGSCIGVAAYEPVSKTGCLLHFMLPDSRLMPTKSKEQPAMFADTGFQMLLKSFEHLKIDPRSLRVFIAGGAAVISQKDLFKIGPRNITQIKHILNDNKIPVVAEELGGNTNRTLHFQLNTGIIRIKTGKNEKQICLK